MKNACSVLVGKPGSFGETDTHETSRELTMFTHWKDAEVVNIKNEYQNMRKQVKLSQ
jgi:hypothetical protein